VKLLISDANILIDLEEGELIELLFQLPFKFSIPDILFEEELDEQHGYLVELGLERKELSGESMFYGIELIQRYTNPSRNDCFALALAKHENCPLLTGDKALRAAAVNEAVKVQGTLWVVEQLIRQQLISIDQARAAYEKMKQAGRRLPWPLAETKLAEIAKVLM